MAILSEYQAEHLPALVTEKVEPGAIYTPYVVPDLGQLRVSETGVSSGTYGGLAFLTPIAEIPLEKVTKTEADSYNNWRNNYQFNWRRFFDPIAVQFKIDGRSVKADVSVMPLIAATDYREYINISRGADIAPESGDRHPESLFHAALAVNVESEPVQQAGGFLQTMVRGVSGGPFSWLGSSISLYVDQDMLWQEAANSPDKKEFIRHNWIKAPVALRAEVSDGFKLAIFLSGLRAFVEQTGPNLTSWNSRQYKDRDYVVISATQQGRNTADALSELQLFYVTSPKSLLVTLNENLLKRSIDRELESSSETAQSGDKAQDQADSTSNQRPWLGSDLAVQARKEAIQTIEAIFGSDYFEMVQVQSWHNIPILNEWKRLFPDRNPLEVHEEIWKVRLKCPGGGQYVWNEEFRTMESTVCGHPAQPEREAKVAGPWDMLEFINAGLTFENDGLRAQVELHRTTQ
jgi:hypothetical protein